MKSLFFKVNLSKFGFVGVRVAAGIPSGCGAEREFSRGVQ
jgi:hypothetical protein